MRRMYSHPGEYRKIFLANYLCIGFVPGGKNKQVWEIFQNGWGSKSLFMRPFLGKEAAHKQNSPKLKANAGAILGQSQDHPLKKLFTCFLFVGFSSGPNLCNVQCGLPLGASGSNVENL